MKCLISFLLTLLCVNLINSIPYTDEDYLEAIQDVKYLFKEGSGQAEAEESLTTTTPNENLTVILGSLDGIITGDDLVPLTTTPIPEDLSMYTKENLQDKIRTRFNDLRKEFSNNQKEILDKSRSSRDEHKISSFTFINLFQNKYDMELNQANENINRLESKRKEIENSIKEIQEYSMNDVQNAAKIKTLKERKKILEGFKDQGCDECHGFLDDNTIDYELKNIDKEIAKIENNADVNADRKELLDLKEVQAINRKYSELIHIYKKEVEERKRKEQFEQISKIIQEKLMNYTELIENNLNEELESMQNFAEKFLNIEELKSNTNEDQSVDDSNKYSDLCSSTTYEWKIYESRSDTKENGVLGGIDLDESELYVIRKKSDDEYRYGKLALRPSRVDAYVTTSSSEIAIDNFEILVSKKHEWRSSESYELPKDRPPICRAKKGASFVPGTLLEDGRCRIGFGYDVIKYNENFEILSFNCLDFNLESVKKWF